MTARGLTAKDRIGQRVGRLIVLERAENKIEGNNVTRACWLCKCDCGNQLVITGHSLSKAINGKGGTRSCGCLAKEKPIKHGMHNTSIYNIWAQMIQRCSNPKNTHYASYGGRGIKVCDKWKDFSNFYADMGKRPPSKTLDRKDNSLGYSKSNCQWATMKEQGNNRRTNLLISFNGKKKTLSQWADVVNLSYTCLGNRLRRGWSVEKALSTPTLKIKELKL